MGGSAGRDYTAPQSGQFSVLEAPGDRPLRIDAKGIALLRDRLRAANTDNPQFEAQSTRLIEVLRELLRRLATEFPSQIDRVLAVGDWARHGLDLRGLPCDDVVVLIVVRLPERPFDLYLQIADRVFADLGDEDLLLQFRLETLAEWRQAEAAAQARGGIETLGIQLLARA